jgi:hypothetical protein
MNGKVGPTYCTVSALLVSAVPTIAQKSNAFAVVTSPGLELVVGEPSAAVGLGVAAGMAEGAVAPQALVTSPTMTTSPMSQRPGCGDFTAGERNDWIESYVAGRPGPSGTI